MLYVDYLERTNMTLEAVELPVISPKFLFR
jgi:hypothetical protein